MKTDKAKMTFRFPDRKHVEHNDDERVDQEQIELSSSVTWSEWNTIEVDKLNEENHTDDFSRNVMKKEPNTSSREELSDNVNQDYHSLQDQEQWLTWGQEKASYPDTPQEEPRVTIDQQVLLETDSIKEREEWTWTHSPVYEDIGPTHTRTRPPAVMKLIGSVIGAVATGLLFTFLAFSLIRGEVTMPDITKSIATVSQLKNDSSTAAPVQQSETVSGNVDAVSEIAVGDEHVQASTTVQIPAAQSYVLQYGVYAKDEGAQQAIAELQNLGMGGVLAHDSEGNRRVYAAVSLERDDAMLLSASLPTKEGSIYVRSFQREAVAELAYTGDSNVLSSFMTQSDLVREWLIQQSSKMLQQASLEAFPIAAMDSLRTEHLRWTQWGQQIQKGLGENATDQWLKMVQAMNTAINAVNEYNKKPAGAHLWNIQQACIQYMLLEQEWLTAMKG